MTDPIPVEVSLRHEQIDVAAQAPPLALRLPDGVTVREAYSRSATVHGVFVLTASKPAVRRGDVASIHEQLVAVVESLRLVWYFAGGRFFRSAPESNHERVFEQLFKAETGHERAVISFPMSWNVLGGYERMPLADAVALLRGLRRIPAEAVVDQGQQALWTCLKAFQAATVATEPLDRFVRTFPALDILAQRHDTKPRSIEVEEVMKSLRSAIQSAEPILGTRTAEVLSGSLKLEALRDRFEAFVKDRLPDEAEDVNEAFKRYNSLRNAVFHEARFDMVDRNAAEATWSLLERCLRVEMAPLLEEGRRMGAQLAGMSENA